MNGKNNLGILNPGSLFFIYILLAVCIFFLSDIFLTNILQYGNLPSITQTLVYFTVSLVITAILIIYGVNFLRDLIHDNPGVRLKLRLNSYFLSIIILISAPFAAAITLVFSKTMNYFNSWELNITLEEAETLALENYTLRINDASKKAKSGELTIDNDLLSIEEYHKKGEGWVLYAFTGDEKYKITAVPPAQSGILVRDMKYDRDIIRYVDADKPDVLNIYTFSLSAGFDSAVERIRAGRLRLETFQNIIKNYPVIIVFYHFMILFPLIVVSFIIAINFTEKIALPIIELNNATKKVSNGDYSVQIYSHDKDELGLLIMSFNKMVLSLESSKSALARAENVSIWQNMARQLAHEIKNPLTPVRLSAERVLRNLKNNPAKLNEIIESSMNVIIKEIDNLTGILNEFRTLSRPIETKTSLVVFKDVLDECISIFKYTYPKINFVTKNISGKLQVYINDQHLKQIINNIIINAIDATEKKGTIEISAAYQTKIEKTFLKIIISDNGTGIDDEAKSKIFTPYWTSKPEGTGLGLPIVERIVRDYGGELDFNSALGVGTTFVILLPGK